MSKVKILVVENNDVRGGALALILSQFGDYETSRASTVNEALTMIKDTNYDLVMTNTHVQQPLDGVKLAQIVLLRSVVAHPPLVMMVTLEKELQLVRKCRHIGVVDYLVYPYDPEALLQRVAGAFDQKKGLSKEDARKAISATLKKIVDLPTISQVHDRITNLLSSKKSSAADVARVMEIDQSITAKTLRLANSAVFGFNRNISSVKEAIAMIGFEQVTDLVTAVNTFEALGRVKESPYFNRMAFWEHSIGCGIIAKVVGEKIKMDPERAFVAGLLHDIGKVVMDGFFPEYFSEALELANNDDIPIHDAESKKLPITHDSVGSVLARQWNLPEALIDVIGAHHSLKPNKSAYMRLTLLVHVADAQCRLLGVGNAGDRATWHPDARILKRLSINPSDLEEWKPEIAENIKLAQSMLELVG